MNARSRAGAVLAAAALLLLQRAPETFAAPQRVAGSAPTVPVVTFQTETVDEVSMTVINEKNTLPFAAAGEGRARLRHDSRAPKTVYGEAGASATPPINDAPLQVGLDKGARNGFDPFGGRCQENAISCNASASAIAVSPTTIFGATRFGAVSVTSLGGSAPSGWPKSISSFVGKGAPTFETSYQVPRTFYDPQSGRFWFHTSSLDEQIHRTELIVAVSQTGDPTGSWNVYRFRTNLNAKFAESPSAAGFGFNGNAVFVSANVLSNTTGAFIFAYVLALDKHRMESGQPVAATALTHIKLDGTLADSLEPVVPSGASDIVNGSQYMASTFNYNTNFGCTTNPCSGVIVWNLSDALGKPKLEARVAPIMPYVKPLSWDPNFDLLPPNTAISATPILSSRTISLGFTAGHGGFVVGNNIRWANISIRSSAPGGFAVRTLAEGRIDPPNNRFLDFPTVTPDAAGNLYVVYKQFAQVGVLGVDDETLYQKYDAASGKILPARLVKKANSPAFAYGAFVGYAASAFANGKVWTMAPYSGSGIDAWVAPLP